VALFVIASSLNSYLNLWNPIGSNLG
jgi:hypothetical protein